MKLWKKKKKKKTSRDITSKTLSLLFQEIDGKALLLLNSDMLMKYMSLKLGPALKLCHIIEKLKRK